MGEPRCDTFQQAGKPKRYVMACFFRFVEPVHVQQVVQQVQDMFAQYADIGQMSVAFFAVAHIHRQFSAAIDDTQRGAYVMGNRQNDFLAHIQKVAVFIYDFLHLLPKFRVSPQMPLNNHKGDNQQDDGRENKSRDDAGGASVRLRDILFPILECGLHVVVDASEQGEQFPVQFPVAGAQAVGIVVHIAYPFHLQGE